MKKKIVAGLLGLSAAASILLPLVPAAHATEMFTMPSPTAIMASTTPWSTEFFSSFLSPQYIILGAIIGGAIIALLRVAILRGASRAIGGGRRGRRGRRR